MTDHEHIRQASKDYHFALLLAGIRFDEVDDATDAHSSSLENTESLS